MIIYVDIDETICVNEDTDSSLPRDYRKSLPLKKNIQAVNEMYDAGHTIIYWTARGTQTGEDWSAVTIEQFNLWHVKYHEIKFGKPYYDIFICDKSLNPKDWNETDNTRPKRIERIARKE